MTKEKIIDFLISHECTNDFALEVISEYINTTKHKDKSSELIQLILQNPQLIQVALQKSIKYLISKYNIITITKNNKTITYC